MNVNLQNVLVLAAAILVAMVLDRQLEISASVQRMMLRAA